MRNLYLGSYYYRMNEYCMRARQIGIRIIYESSSTNSSSKDRIYLLSLPRNIFKIVDLYDYILKDQRNVLKIGIRFKSQCDLDIAKQSIERSFPEVNVFEVGNIGLEITEKLASKKDSLEKLCTHLNVDSSNVLAIGDNGYDVEMLKWAGVGVAMKNAVIQAKEVANIICEDNNHDGAAHFLEEYLL